MRRVCILCILAFALRGVAAGGQADTVEAAIARAGNAADDAERLAILKQVLKRGDLSDELRTQFAPLVKTIDQYVHSGNITTFGRSKGFEHKIPDDSPLYPLVCFYRARTLIWHMLEHGGIMGYPERRRDYINRSTKLLRVAQKAFPDNPVIAMYLGKPIPPHKHYPPVEGAPTWAIHQREALERLSDIIEWWIDHRQHGDGSYGGGLEDDCEMWRWWAPVLIGFQSPKIEAAQRKLSERILRDMPKSFSKRMSDVEHSAEPSADSITPMMHLAPDDPAWKRHALNLVGLMKTLWTGRNERGFLMFKSTYFCSERIDAKPQRACDSVYHVRAIQPALLYWLRTGDKAVGELVADWMKTWVDAAARAERGKPAGIIPSAIHWPDGKAGGTGPNWWEPKNYGTKLYDWPSAMSQMTHALLQTHHMTGDRACLEPILSMARFRRKVAAMAFSDLPSPGSEVWCGLHMDGFLMPTLAKYRFLTGDKQFDDLLVRRASAYVRYRLQRDRAGLESALKSTAAALRVNWPGYTTEVRWTDRVLRFPSGWLGHCGYKQSSPDTNLLYSSATGDPGGVGYFPMNAVRWLTPPRDIAALVLDNSTTHLTAQLFHFGAQPRKLAAELYLLKPGRYQLEVTREGKTVLGDPIDVRGPRTRVDLMLPPRVACTLRVHLR